MQENIISCLYLFFHFDCSYFDILYNFMFLFARAVCLLFSKSISELFGPLGTFHLFFCFLSNLLCIFVYSYPNPFASAPLLYSLLVYESFVSTLCQSVIFEYICILISIFYLLLLLFIGLSVGHHYGYILY